MSGNPHILLVDDDADFRAAVALTLRFQGHLVTEAADGRLALIALSSGTPFQLIILDLAMPGMDGETFLAHKSRGAHAAIPVVIFSSSTSPTAKEFADVCSVVHKLDGLTGLLPAIRQASGGVHD